jgi:hypothetical protein
MKRLWIASVFFLLAGFPLCSFAQFSSGLQGVVQDASGSVIPGATVVLTNTATSVKQSTTTGAQGEYRFVSLPPGNYEVTVSANGFATRKTDVTLQTEQTRDLPVALAVGGTSQTVEVTNQVPVLDTADSRTQLTIQQEALNSLPLPGRNILNLTTIAPGVTGLGLQGNGGNGQSNDNYAAETQVSASANGRSSVGNSYILDGLDITSNITPGVLNLVPNPDTIQEASVQVNTFSTVYGRSSSIEEVMTTRSGASQYHFLASDYFTNQDLTAGTEFVHKYAPFHTNNISTTLSGPVPLLHKTYFFTGWEPLLGLTSTGNQVSTFESPEFTQWAQQNYPNTVGTKLLTSYPASGATISGVAKTAAQIFPDTCGTAATNNLPCDMPLFDNGVFNASNYRNALQYNVRVDKYFSEKDRVYANYYQTGLDLGGPALRVDMGTPQHYIVRSIQGNETHVFSPDTINEANFGFLRMEGLLNKTGPFHVPVVGVTGWSANIGVSKAHEDYVQHHYVWHDAFTHIHRGHDIQIGYQGFHGDNLTFFGPWFSQPTFTFTTLLDLVQDKPYSESGVSYDLLTGQPAGLRGGSFQYTGNTWGLYAQDTWKASKRLTLTYGLRWDNFGNPTPSSGTIASNFFLGPGTTIPQQVANGYVKQVPHVLNQSIKAFSPRAGAAWDIADNGNWVLHGGAGLYHDWVTLGNVQNEFGNPPAPVSQTFITGTTVAPIFMLGNSDTFPFGFTYPSIPTSGLNDHGGIVGLQSNIAGNDPNLKASNTLNYAVSLERALGRDFSLAAGYSGSHSSDLFTDFGGHTTNAYYGYDINNFPGSLIQNAGKVVRLSPNFGSIRYTANGPTSTYNAFILDFRGRVHGRGFIDASYTRSSSWDDAGTYPTVPFNSGTFGQYWAPSSWDVPNRLSLAWSYQIPGISSGFLPLTTVTNGWELSSVTVLQSGTPYSVYTSAPFSPIFDSAHNVVGNKGGDYNADGNNYDFPDVGSYRTPTSRHAYLNGVFSTSAFAAPGFAAEGNEKVNRFRNPGFANTDLAFIKNNHIWERANLQLRLEFFNLFNRPNLGGVNGNLASASFGKATSQYNSRFLQIGAKFEF